MDQKVWNHHKIAYGGDYNPEQWPQETWEEDMRILKEAHIDTLTLNVFSWAMLQPSEEEYDFSKLDQILELAKANDMKVCLATSTGAHPAWMARKYPEILRVEINGMKRKFGGRHNSCPNSFVYRKYATLLAEKLAKRYKTYDNLIGWHISNEYGGECYCKNCEKAFRVWLQKKYKTIDEVNRVWDTAFWGHTFYEWEDIVLPDFRSEHFDYERTMFQGISLDYRRFNSDSILDCYKLEYQAIKAVTPDIPITTNLMGFYKALDYQKWAKEMDFVSWDNYPSNEDSPALIAMNHDLMRGIKGGNPFILMEQTPSVTNWLPYNALKRPNVMRLWSYQAVAHGSDSVMFFQMKRSIGACEKYHGAVIDHAGRTDTRVFQEIKQLGAELDLLQEQTLASRVEASVAIIFDWDNWWAIEFSAGPSVKLKYKDEILNYYQAFHSLNIAVDIISPNDDYSKYKIIVAPILYMVKPKVAKKIEDFVSQGNQFITTFFSGYVEEHDLVTPGGYPGELKDVLGIWVEESDALPEEKQNSFFFEGKEYPAKLLCDLLHTNKATALSYYEKDFYAAMPVITKNQFGLGNAYYVACQSSKEFYYDFMSKICQKQKINPALEPQEGLEAIKRVNDNETFLFVLNHNEKAIEVKIQQDARNLLTQKSYKKEDVLKLEPKDVVILKQK